MKALLFSAALAAAACCAELPPTAEATARAAATKLGLRNFEVGACYSSSCGGVYTCEGAYDSTVTGSMALRSIIKLECAGPGCYVVER